MDRRSLIKGIAGAIVAGPAVAEAALEKPKFVTDVLVAASDAMPLDGTAVSCVPYWFEKGYYTEYERLVDGKWVVETHLTCKEHGRFDGKDFCPQCQER